MTEAPEPEIRTDSHAHLSMVSARAGRAALEGVLAAYDAAWEAARESGRPGDAPRVVDPGTRADDLPERVREVGRRPWLRFAAGIWPGAEALRLTGPHVAALEAAASSPDCAAIGEGGLDYHWMHGTREAQRLLFEAQIDLARRLGKPLIVHSREAHEDTVEILRASVPGIPVVIHCFGYDARAVRDYLDLGCFVSFAGNLTYPAARNLREACVLVPRDRLLLETDSPYMAPVPERGRPCTPLLVGHTYAFAAQLRGEDESDLARGVTENTSRIFFGDQ